MGLREPTSSRHPPNLPDTDFSEPLDIIFSSIYRTRITNERVFFDQKNSIFKEGIAEIRLMKVFEEYLYLPGAGSLFRSAIYFPFPERCLDMFLVSIVFVTVIMVILFLGWFYVVVRFSPLPCHQYRSRPRDSPAFYQSHKKSESMDAGRQGPSVFQTYYTIAKLLKKEVIYASASSRIMRVTPVVNVALQNGFEHGAIHRLGRLIHRNRRGRNRAQLLQLVILLVRLGFVVHRIEALLLLCAEGLHLFGGDHAVVVQPLGVQRRHRFVVLRSLR